MIPISYHIELNLRPSYTWLNLGINVKDTKQNINIKNEIKI